MYYLLKKNPFFEPEPYMLRTTGWNEDLDNDEFTDGVCLSKTFDKPLEFELYEYQKGDIGMAEFHSQPFPIMSDKLISALQEAGVDNIQTFPAVLRGHFSGNDITSYKVVNIVGLIAAADMDKSDYIDMGGMGIIAVGFKDLVIDETKAYGALLFRLAESITDIVIHESVKNHLETRGFNYLRYLPCE